MLHETIVIGMTQKQVEHKYVIKTWTTKYH